MKFWIYKNGSQWRGPFRDQQSAKWFAESSGAAFRTSPAPNETEIVMKTGFSIVAAGEASTSAAGDLVLPEPARD